MANPVSSIRVTHVGGPTVLLEIGPWRLLTDPTFDPPGRRYAFGWGTSSRKTAGPAIAPDAIGPIDAVLLSHDQHADNLDDAGRAFLPKAGQVITTVAGARRLTRGASGGPGDTGAIRASGLAPWGRTVLTKAGAPPIQITATPCRHGPPLLHHVSGDVIGFSLTWEGQQHGALWISGDTVLEAGVREVADLVRVGTAVLHLGGVRFPVTGPLRFTLTARDGAELTHMLRPRTVIPVHYEGWSHFVQGRSDVERAFVERSVPAGTEVRWIGVGSWTEIDV